MSFFDEFIAASRSHTPPPRQISGHAQRRVADVMLKANAVRTIVGASGSSVTSAGAATTAGAVTAGGLVGGAAIGTAVLGLMSISDASERGDALASSNAFVLSFARAVSDFSRRRRPQRNVPGFPRSSRGGRNMAIHILNGMSAVERNRLFLRYSRMSDRAAVSDLVTRLGGNQV